jgi:putative intracellular protease/amidase
MKRITTFVAIAVCMAVCLSLIPTKVVAESRPKVLLIPREGASSVRKELMLTKEVGVMTNLLKEAGYDVEVATASGQPIVGSETLKLTPDLKLSNVKVTDYVGIIMPCMNVGPLVTPEAVAVVKQAIAQGKLVAAQAGSVRILAEAGALKGKKYAFQMNPIDMGESMTRFGGAIYSQEPVVRDGKIITSCCCPAFEFFVVLLLNFFLESQLQLHNSHKR